jgi:hypothetical protein
VRGVNNIEINAGRIVHVERRDEMQHQRRAAGKENRNGLRLTYAWISGQLMRNARSDGEVLRVSVAASKPANIRAVS